MAYDEQNPLRDGQPLTQLAEAIRRVLEQVGSQAALARAIRVSEATIARYCAAASQPDVPVRRRLAALCGQLGLVELAQLAVWNALARGEDPGAARR